jgi:hypothetical protein
MRAHKSTSTEADRAYREEARRSGIPERVVPVSAGAAVVGALGGAVLGTFGGPIGIVLGAIVGAAGGIGVGDVLNTIREHHRAHDEQLDKDIGVIGGDIGAAPWDQPPPVIGAYSMGSAGGGSTPVGAEPDEGPTPTA